MSECVFQCLRTCFKCVFVLCSTLVSFNHTWEIYVRFMCVVSVCVSLLMHKIVVLCESWTIAQESDRHIITVWGRKLAGRRADTFL